MSSVDSGILMLRCWLQCWGGGKSPKTYQEVDPIRDMGQTIKIIKLDRKEETWTTSTAQSFPQRIRSSSTTTHPISCPFFNRILLGPHNKNTPTIAASRMENPRPRMQQVVPEPNTLASCSQQQKPVVRIPLAPVPPPSSSSSSSKYLQFQYSSKSSSTPPSSLLITRCYPFNIKVWQPEVPY